MNRFHKLLVLLALLVSWTATSTHAQSDYYWSDGKQHPLFEDRTSVMVHFDGQVNPTALDNLLKASSKVESADYFAIRNRAVIHFKSPQTGTVKEVMARLGLDDFPVRSAHFGYTLDDGFQMWLTHQVVLRMKPGLDWFMLTPYLSDDQMRFYDEAYGNVRFEIEDVNQVIAMANAIQNSGMVEYCHPDFYAPITRFQDPLYPDQFQMNNTGQTIDGYAGVNDIDIDAPEAWAITTGSASVIVAMVDDGVENHEDLNDSNGATRIVGGYTPVNGGNGAPTASSAHGESTAGIVAASHNSLGVRGVAPASHLLTVNIFAGSETPTDIANGFNWAVSNGAWVLSNSWGYTSCTASYSVLTNAINNAANNGRGGLGCVVVFASGNGYKSCVDYPANLASVIAVGAVTNQGVRSAYSNYGADLDIVAPSNGAAGVRTTDRMGSPGYSSGNYTTTFGGTSAACPAVAGVAALTLAANNALTGAQVKSILESTADDMGPSGWDQEYANGRVNAYQAVLCAQNGGNCAPPPPPPPSYCASQGSNSSYEWISNVTIGTFSNNSGSAGYSDFTGLTVNAAQGSNYNVSLSPAFSGTTYDEYFKIWIDFNQDMDFDDAGEEVFSAGPSTTTVTGSIAIPSNASTGNTRMRVSMKWNAFQTSCEIFGYGEVEDYTINISAGGPPPTCDAPSGLNSSNITSSSATLAWNAVSGAVSYDLRIRPSGGSYTQFDNLTGTSVTLNGLAANTTYEWSVRTDCSGGNSSAWTADATFTTSAPPGNNYCSAGGTNANDEWIDLVQFGFNNPTGSDGGYADYTNLSASVSPGTNYTIYYSKGSPFTDYAYWRIYVDWNQDGDFADSGEREVSRRSRSNGTLSSTISVPSNAVPGTTRMRVMMKYGGYPSYCETYTWGETEDYTIVVSANNNSNGPQNSFVEVIGQEEGVKVMPNPAFDVATVQLNVVNPIERAFIADMNGKVIQLIAPQPGRQEVQVSSLPNGIYLVVVQTETGVFTTRLVKAN
ncbi:MAG: S8 family serine peptidase [Lewinellaceae bacterium]|nr:S8 family serine peptidase [Lewinellaceae bacterium]